MGMPGSEEALLYPGDYHYLAGAVLHSMQTGIPLLNDLAGLPVPLVDGAEEDKAKHLSAMLAIECVKLALPDLPLLRPEDLIEFREDNRDALRAFRRALLRYAGDLNGKLINLTPQEMRLLRLLGEGHHYKTASAEMGITVHTVGFHMRRIYEKLQVHSKSEAVGKAFREGLLR